MLETSPKDRSVSLVTRLAEWIAKPEQMHGRLITENDLSAIFGVSRTPLREAINFANRRTCPSSCPTCGWRP